jgi:(p)ppGpp synthase/HD superfamily hydrolase
MPSPWSQDHYIKAYRFAAQAHWKQKQAVPGTDIPYLMHFSMVAMEVIAALAVNSYLDGDLAVQCALLHDTIEDAVVTISDLVGNFGQKVADGVFALTKDKSIGTELPDKWERKNLRMQDSLRRIKTQPREVWMVKMADRITNLQPPPQTWSEEKIQEYKEESILIYNSLIDGSAFLAERLKEKIVLYPCPDIF